MKPSIFLSAKLLLFTLLLTSCVSIESVVDKNFNKEIKRIFIVIRTSESSEGYSRNLQNELIVNFHRYNVDATVKDLNFLTLEGKEDFNRKIEEFNPDVILAILQTEQMFYNNVSSGAKFELILTEPNSEKPVWKAKLSSDTGGWGIGSSSEAADQIVDKLLEDGLIKRQKTQ